MTTECYTPFVKVVDKIAIEFPDDVQGLNSLEVRYVTGEVQMEELKSFIEINYRPKTAEIAQEFADFMAANPVRFEK